MNTINVVLIEPGKKAKIAEIGTELHDLQKIVEIIFGKFFICDCSGENFGSLSMEQLQRYKEQFLMPEYFYKIGGEIQAIKFDPDREAR